LQYRTLKYPIFQDGLINGAILADQLKSLDWEKREAKFIAKAPKRILDDTIEKLNLVINKVEPIAKLQI